MAQTWWLSKLVDLDRDGILHPIQDQLPDPLIQSPMIERERRKEYFFVGTKCIFDSLVKSFLCSISNALTKIRI